MVLQTFIRRLREWSKQEFRISPKLRRPLVCLYSKIIREKSELWRKCRKRRFLRYYYEIVSYFTTFEENELSKIRKSREFSSPNVFSSREGILQDSHVQRRPSSKSNTKCFCEDLRRKLITCSWHQKNETTNSPIHEFKVLQNVFKIKKQG